MIANVPKILEDGDQEVAEQAYNLYQEILECVRSLDSTFERISRIIYKFIQDERLVEAMGWESPMDIFQEPEIKAHLSRMRIRSRAQFYRWKDWAALDTERPDWHLLRLDKLSQLAATGKTKQLRALVEKKLPKDDELDELVAILGDSTNPIDRMKTKEDDFRVDLKERVGYWKGKPAIRFVGTGMSAIRLISSLSYYPVHWKYYGDTSSIVGYINDDGAKEALILTEDPGFFDWIQRRLKMNGG